MQWWLQTQGVVHVHSVYRRSAQIHLENYQIIYRHNMCKLPDIHMAPGQYSGSKVVTCNKIMSGLGSNDKKQPLENMIH